MLSTGCLPMSKDSRNAAKLGNMQLIYLKQGT